MDAKALKIAQEIARENEKGLGLNYAHSAAMAKILRAQPGDTGKVGDVIKFER